MISLKKNQSGFTIVELLIVIVIIGILAGLVISTFVGVQQKARNSERQTDINNISGQLEAYFAKHSSYPNFTQLTTETWRENNEIRLGDNDKALVDPSDANLVEGTAAPTQIGGYVYNATPAGCTASTDNSDPPAAVSGTFCTGYTLWAFMEGNNTPVYEKKSSN